jgi:hypothetical protein
MTASRSTSVDHKSTHLVIETGTSIKTDIITRPTRAENYQPSEMQVEYLLIRSDADEIVLENFQPLADATTDELRLC